MKDKTENRTKSVKIRLFESELAELNDKKTCNELARWMRETCLGKKTKRRNQPVDVDPKLLRHLAAIGNNINQVARKCNNNLESADALDVIIRLDAIEQVIKEIREHYASKNT
jgi:hypothetical protein